MSWKIRRNGGILAFFLAAAVAGCSGGCSGGRSGAETEKASAQPAASGEAQGIQPCRLLTAAQAATVIPGHDGGSVAHAGGSLMKGVSAYQCSYADKAMNLFTVVLNMAENEERFSWIKPGADKHTDHRRIDAGDEGWIYGGEDDLKIEVVKGRTVVDLELLAPGARAKSEAMIALAKVIAAAVQ